MKEIEIVALDSFDRTCIVTTDSTGEDREELAGIRPTDMDDKAVNYLLKTPGGIFIIPGDSHFRFTFAKHGKDYYDIGVAFGSFLEKIQLGCRTRCVPQIFSGMAENLRCDVVVPIHWDVWMNFQGRLRRDQPAL